MGIGFGFNGHWIRIQWALNSGVMGIGFVGDGHGSHNGSVASANPLAAGFALPDGLDAQDAKLVGPADSRRDVRRIEFYADVLDVGLDGLYADFADD